jgi:glutamate N-acetyltransferase/amino-acid N-acetyltransferase
MERSPLALPFPDLAPIAGVRIGTASVAYKKWTRDCVTLVELAPGTVVAGVTTQSKCPSPEVELCRAKLPQGQARGLIVNAGNSNAFTGMNGRQAAAAQAARVAEVLSCNPDHVFSASTGVIGVPLPVDLALSGATQAHAALGTADWLAATNAIGTTDTFPKAATASAIVAGTRVTIVGIVKGSGMIMPDMATMLGFIFSDAAVTAGLWQQMLQAAVAPTFNSITVDSDTSTSDTVLAFATGAAGHPVLTSMDDAGADALAAALADVCRQLAILVGDGEGAQKLIEVNVAGAVDNASAKRVAISIANSPLLKTAIAGGDANWGRVVMAVGKAGEPAERDLLSIRFGDTLVAEQGMVVPGYDEAPVAAHLAGQEVRITVDLGLGHGRARVWTCDLTHGYISINADYRS